MCLDTYSLSFLCNTYLQIPVVNIYISIYNIGSIWRSYHKLLGRTVIKSTNKALHSNKIVIKNGIKYAVDENILNENSILKYLTSDNLSPPSIIKYYDSFQRLSYNIIIVQKLNIPKTNKKNLYVT